jgi:hypothetical protein
MITYLVGVLPIFLGGFALVQRHRDPQFGWARVCKQLAISLGAFALCYLVLWAITGFNPIATLRE